MAFRPHYRTRHEVSLVVRKPLLIPQNIHSDVALVGTPAQQSLLDKTIDIFSASTACTEPLVLGKLAVGEEMSRSVPECFL